MKKLLLILLLLPFTAFAQEPPLESFETVRESYWKISVAGDTLPDQFDRFDTAVSWAREVAETFGDNSELPQIKIHGPDWRAEYAFRYAWQDTVQVIDSTFTVIEHESPALRNVRWQHDRAPVDSMNTITLKGEANGFVEVSFADSTISGTIDSAFTHSYSTDFLGDLSLEVISRSGQWQSTWRDTLDMALLDTLGGLQSIADYKKKADSMAFPTVADRLTQTYSVSNGQWVVNMPATVNENDFLYIIVSDYRTTTINTPTDWTAAWKTSSSAGFYLVPNSTQASNLSGGSVTITFADGTNKGSTIVLRVDASTWNHPSGFTFGTLAEGSSNSPNPPSVTAGGGSGDNLFIAHAVALDDEHSWNGFPTNYTQGQTSVNSLTGTNNSAGAASAERELSSASDDPGTFTLSESEGWDAQTLVIEPAGGTTVELTPDSLSHNHTLESPAFESNYALAPNGLQHGHSLESPTFLSKYTLSANGLQHGHSLESPLFNAVYILSADGLRHGHTLQQSTLAVAFTLQANGMSHAHTLEQPPFNVNYGLAPNGMQHGHSLDSPSTTPAYIFSPNGLSHGHTLESTVISALYSLSANGLRHGHSLDSPTTVPGYTFAPEGLQHAHTIEATTIADVVLLVPDNMSHGHSLEPSSVEASYLLSVNGLRHTHNLSGSQIAVVYGLSPNSLQHSHSLEASKVAVNYLIAPENLQHAHSLEQAGLTPHYLFTPEDLRHNHTLEQAVLQTIGEATKLQLSANELYAINLQAKKLYRVSLATTEDAQELNANDLYTITTDAKKQYIITLNANEKID